MRSVSWLHCAAILGGLWFSSAPALAQENWHLPATDREVWLAAHEQPIKPPPDVGLPAAAENFPSPPGPKQSWLERGSAVNPPPLSATREDALNAPNCGCEDVQFTCCPPTWLIRAEALIWTRSAGAAQVLATSGAGTLNVTDLTSNWAAGPRITAQRQNIFGTAWDAEIVYFGIDGFLSTGTLAATTSIATTPPIFVGGLNTTFRDTTRLYNAEFNLRRELTERLTFVNGFRYLQLSDHLNTNIGGVATHDVDVDNHLYGYQVGADYRIWTNNSRWFLDGFGKAGIYGNSADQSTTINGVGGAVPTVGAIRSQVAFVGEAGFYGGYRFTDSLRLIGGYNVLWLTGVADAPSQIPATDIVAGTAVLATNSTPFFHGATVGLEWVR